MIITVTVWGSMNVRDQSDQLIQRSHRQTQAGWAQQAPMETPDALNIEYTNKGPRKRRGQATDASLATLMAAGETLIHGYSWHHPTTGAQIQIVVSTRTIYVDQAAAGSFVQVNASTSTSYVHAATVTAVSIVPIDGHAIIGLNGANQMQVYKTSADLDPRLVSGQLWESAYGATSETITGTWNDATYLLTSIHGRLAYSDGTNLVEFTPGANDPSSGVWNLLGAHGGAQFGDGAIRMLATMNPGEGDAKDSLLYIGTLQGMSYLSGFQEYDRIEERIDIEPVLNHRSYFTVKNWLVWITREKNIKAAHAGYVIDLGRRMKTTNRDGPLDAMDVSESLLTAFAFYDPDNKVGGFAFTTATGRVNDTIIALDFKLGEPQIGEPMESYERKVRLMKWQINLPDTNDWFIHIYQRDNALVGLTQAGLSYTLNSLTVDNDLASIAIEAKLSWPDFAGGDEFSPNQMQWFRFDQAYESLGDWDVTTRFFLNRDNGSANDYLVDQVNTGAFLIGTSEIGDSLGSSGMVRHYRRMALRSETVRPRIENDGQNETFTLMSQSLTYEPKAIVR